MTVSIYDPGFEQSGDDTESIPGSSAAVAAASDRAVGIPATAQPQQLPFAARKWKTATNKVKALNRFRGKTMRVLSETEM